MVDRTRREVVGAGLALPVSSGPTASAAGHDAGALRRVLHAAGPSPAIAGPARTFDPLIGRWSTSYAHYANGLEIERYRGEVVFGWILDGWALQDVWIGYPDRHRPRSVGTTIRYWVPEKRAWNVVYFSPQEAAAIEMSGGASGDRIVLLGRRDDGRWRRWSFVNITGTSFEWRGEIGEPDDDRWEVVARYLMRR